MKHIPLQSIADYRGPITEYAWSADEFAEEFYLSPVERTLVVDLLHSRGIIKQIYNGYIWNDDCEIPLRDLPRTHLMVSGNSVRLIPPEPERAFSFYLHGQDRFIHRDEMVEISANQKAQVSYYSADTGRVCVDGAANAFMLAMDFAAHFGQEIEINYWVGILPFPLAKVPPFVEGA